METSEAAVVGLGPAGLAAGLALASAGITTALIGPPPTSASLSRETRTTALFGGSIDLLRHLGVWDSLAPKAEALIGLRLIDDTGGLLRAPETLFKAHEIGQNAFGFNIANADLIAALHARATEVPEIRTVPHAVAEIQPAIDHVALTLASGDVYRPLLVTAADGRNSRCREASGARTDAWSYPQTAVATRFHHTRPHDGISTEFHRRAGPLTTVPMPGLESSLVWVETPTETERLGAMDDEHFARELEHRLGGLLGTITRLGPRAAFPLAGLTAKPLANRRIALIGEAGHMLPPIGAQGLNLGFRDAAWIAELAGAAKAAGRDVGDPRVMAAYNDARASDVAIRTMAVDMLNRSLLAGFMPFDLMRGAGLAALGAMPWLRRMIMQSGIGPGGPEPALLKAFRD